jgi:hypothetical protein
MFPTTILMFFGTVISVFMTLDFLRPVRRSSPF